MVLISKKICGILIFVAMAAWYVQSLSDLLSLWINFCGQEAYHEIHENLCTLKISTCTINSLQRFCCGLCFNNISYVFQINLMIKVHM